MSEGFLYIKMLLKSKTEHYYSLLRRITEPADVIVKLWTYKGVPGFNFVREIGYLTG
jgi:hypothetical protein